MISYWELANGAALATGTGSILFFSRFFLHAVT
jgi:hypothetical protein